MHTALLLEMAAGAFPERLAVGSLAEGTTFAELAARVRASSALMRRMFSVSMGAFRRNPHNDNGKRYGRACRCARPAERSGCGTDTLI